MEKSEVFEDLTMLLLYMQSWREKVVDSVYVSRAWKGYDFDVLDRLREKGYVSGSRKAKSVILTDEGVKRGKELKQKLLESVG